jgi:hypothetical protein
MSQLVTLILRRRCITDLLCVGAGKVAYDVSSEALPETVVPSSECIENKLYAFN